MSTQYSWLSAGLPLDSLPENQGRVPGVPHAPKVPVTLSKSDFKLAIRNALRYFPTRHHAALASEFAQELRDYGHIYMYRFRPTASLHAVDIKELPWKSQEAGAMMLMILNNLDPAVAQFPHELVTYGGNGQVFSNWAQFRLVMHYLSTMADDQTLVMYSGHPMGLFPSRRDAPRAVITNGMMIPNYSSPDQYTRYFALGVTIYGQMTAGSYCYIGPQGIVHGTTITVLNAGRMYLHTEDMAGKVFVTSGLGGMSGAQPKAAVIAGCIGVIAEINPDALRKRQAQGWLMESTNDLDELVDRVRQAKKAKETLSIGYLGNIVDLWEHLANLYEKTGEMLVELGTDQTSCHNPYNGGYYPVSLSYEEANRMMSHDAVQFKQSVQSSLKRQIKAIDVLAHGGMRFWDYGNAFLLECSRAGADVKDPNDSTGLRFKYPSYVQDIMGDIFSLGYGPFRWVCTSCDPADLRRTDEIALKIMKHIQGTCDMSAAARGQLKDNIYWIEHADEHQMVVGSQARILYTDQRGRISIALAFNEAIAKGEITAPIVLSRDHHDVSGTDGPYRETSNIYDGSSFTADMAVQNCIGDAMRGASWVALHNGGGVGWGEVINGGFGLVIDGSQDSAMRARCMLAWDVSNGVARRSWAGNCNARSTIERTIEESDGKLRLTMPEHADDATVDAATEKCFDV